MSSLPAPPSMTSLPEPPEMTSLPLPPSMTSSPPPPEMTSALFVPDNVSSPQSPLMVVIVFHRLNQPVGPFWAISSCPFPQLPYHRCWLTASASIGLQLVETNGFLYSGA